MTEPSPDYAADMEEDQRRLAKVEREPPDAYDEEAQIDDHLRRNDVLTNQDIDLTAERMTMISDLQCPGCTLGCSPCHECESFKPQNGHGAFSCSAHSAGTMITGMGWVYLGMPKGFNRVGAFQPKHAKEPANNIRMFIAPDLPMWDNFNIPVWGMEKDGFLFVRTYSPRINLNYIDVIKGGTCGDLPKGTVDVGQFIDEID